MGKINIKKENAEKIMKMHMINSVYGMCGDHYASPEAVKKVVLARKTAYVNFFRCPVCGDEGTVIGETFYCSSCGCEIDNVYEEE